MLGLTSVHVNRVVQNLRRAGLIVWQAGALRIPDLQRLLGVADFDASYLHLPPRCMT